MRLPKIDEECKVFLYNIHIALESMLRLTIEIYITYI